MPKYLFYSHSEIKRNHDQIAKCEVSEVMLTHKCESEGFYYHLQNFSATEINVRPTYFCRRTLINQ